MVPPLLFVLMGWGVKGRGVMDTQEGAGIQTPLDSTQGAPGVTQPLPLFVPRCSPSSIVKTKGSSLACAGAGNLNVMAQGLVEMVVWRQPVKRWHEKL